MRIESVTIHNFRGIRNMELDCKGLVNVIIGNNGVVKSSVIAAIEILYSWLAARIKSGNGNGRPIAQKDITNGEIFCRLSMTASHEGKTATWTVAKKRSGYKVQTAEKTDLAELKRFVEEYDAKSNDGDFSHWPMLVSYGVNRGVMRVQLSTEGDRRLTVANIYDTGIFGRGTNWHEMFDWFVARESEENRMRLNFSPEYRDIQLEAIRNNIEKMLPEYTNLHIASKPTRLAINKGNEELDFTQLSDGEKCYIALMMDITRHITMIGADTEKAEQVFLIDEVDLHLHPEWQTRVVGALKQMFPKCQFIISSHSSLILSDLNPSEGDTLTVMEQGKKKEISSMPYGDTSNYILQRFFGLKKIRNGNVQQRIDDAADELAKPKPDLQKVKSDMDWLKENEVQYDEMYKLSLELMKKQKHAQDK